MAAPSWSSTRRNWRSRSSGSRRSIARTRFREVWREERLVAFDGLVEDNGEPFPGHRARRRRPPGRRRSRWTDRSARRHRAERALARIRDRTARWFFDSRTGELLNATVTRAGREPLKVGARVVEATRYEIGGDLEQHVWFDDSGAWVQWRLWRQGAAITLARE